MEMLSSLGCDKHEFCLVVIFLRTSGRCNRQSEFTLPHFTIFH